MCVGWGMSMLSASLPRALKDGGSAAVRGSSPMGLGLALVLVFESRGCCSGSIVTSVDVPIEDGCTDTGTGTGTGVVAASDCWDPSVAFLLPSSLPLLSLTFAVGDISSTLCIDPLPRSAENASTTPRTGDDQLAHPWSAGVALGATAAESVRLLLSMLLSVLVQVSVSVPVSPWSATSSRATPRASVRSSLVSASGPNSPRPCGR